MENIIQIIGNVGFPIAMAIYLLIIFEKKIDKLTESIDQLTDYLKNQTL